MLILVKELRYDIRPVCYLITSYRSVCKQNWDAMVLARLMESEVTEQVKAYKAFHQFNTKWPQQREFA